MKPHSLALARYEIIGHLQAATTQHRMAAKSLGVRLGGRPTKYRPELAILAYSILTDVRTLATTRYVAAMFGVSRSTLYEWIHAHEDLRFGIESGKALQESWLATCLLHGHGNLRGIRFILMNLHGWHGHPTRHILKSADLADAIKQQENGRAVVREN